VTDIVETQEEERGESGGCTDRHCRDTGKRGERVEVVLTDIVERQEREGREWRLY
jgi:hypothetical protein